MGNPPAGGHKNYFCFLLQTGSPDGAITMNLRYAHLNDIILTANFFMNSVFKWETWNRRRVMKSKLEDLMVLKGYGNKADTMFVARLIVI